MFVGRRNLTWMSLLWFFGGVLGNMCREEFKQRHICAARGSSLLILCSFINPDRQNLNRFMWSHKKPNKKARFVVGSSFRKVFEQIEYVGDRDQNCSVSIQQVECKHAGNYFVRVKNRHVACHIESVTLAIVDLRVLLVQSNEDGSIKEGDSVNLSCTNSCNDGNKPSTVFSWFKNGEPINEGKTLNLINVSPANNGNYTCSLKTQSGVTSSVRRVNVEYGPKNTSVLIASSVGADDGNITLICSSDAHPPGLNYSWFGIADGQIRTVGHQLVFVPGDGGQYLCSVTNKHGSQNSTVFIWKMKPSWAMVPRDVSLIVIPVLLVVIIIIIAVCRLTRKRPWAQTTGCEEEAQNEDRLVSDGGRPQGDGSRGERDAAEVIYATVIFHNKTKPTMEQQDSGNEVVIYSSVRRTQQFESFIEPS